MVVALSTTDDANTPLSLSGTAKSLSRNPLGVIALFIVVIYALGSLVIHQASTQFFEHPAHPAVLFLAGFPVCVLGVFAWLVGFRHRNLYAPQDYRNEAFFVGDIKAPVELSDSKISTALTSDRSALQAEGQDEDALNESYKDLCSLNFSLLHSAKVIQQPTRTDQGRYHVRIWIEQLLPNGNQLHHIERVSYRLWDDFEPKILTTRNINSSFDLWLAVYGEFPVIAQITLKNGSSIQLQRYIDLPGRPAD